MGILKRLKKLSKEKKEKKKLIIELAKKRIVGMNIDTFSNWKLMQLPEATLVTIVGTYCLLKYDYKLADKKIFETIEKSRCSIGNNGETFSKGIVLDHMEVFRQNSKQYTLVTYIEYRLSLEYPSLQPLLNREYPTSPSVYLFTREYIEEAIEKAQNIFTKIT